MISGANYLLADVQRQWRGRYNHVDQYKDNPNDQGDHDETLNAQLDET